MRALGCSIISLASSCAAFAPVRSLLNLNPNLNQPIAVDAVASSQNAETTTDPKAGIAPFEEWFTSNSYNGARISHIRHAMFHSQRLRGLEFTSTSSQDLNRVAVIPRKMVSSI